MTLEIVGKTINGKSKLGLHSYSNFAEDPIPTATYPSSYTGEYWYLTRSWGGGEGDASDTTWAQSEDNFVRVLTGKSSYSDTSQSSGGTLRNQSDLRGVKRFVVGGRIIARVSSTSFGTTSTDAYVYILNAGSSSILVASCSVVEGDPADDATGFIIRGEIRGDKLYYWYSTNSGIVSSSVTITGKIQIYVSVTGSKGWGDVYIQTFEVEY